MTPISPAERSLAPVDVAQGDWVLRIRVGTAGWAIPSGASSAFRSEGANLSRYASVFDGVEINSTFKKVHRPGTFGRWANCVGPGFQFSVKAPKSVTHDAGGLGRQDCLEAFLDRVAHLGRSLGPLLIQFPPKLAFDAERFDALWRPIRERGAWLVACEPRHQSWFEPEVDGWLAERRIARVGADPALHPGSGDPGGWRGLSYYRLHGSPRVYYSAYGARYLRSLAARLKADEAETIWCIFDNTASGAATTDALTLLALLAPPGPAEQTTGVSN